MVFKLSDDVVFPSTNAYGIPDLRFDMLADLPGDSLNTWIGPATGKAETYLHNWKNADEIGLDTARTIIAFYQDDYKFLQCFQQPAKFTEKLLQFNPLAAVTPNYSMWFEQPAAVKIWAAYRSRFVGRYWQEAGIKVIPDVNFSDADSLAYSLCGIPYLAPLVSLQVQTGRKTKQEIDAKRDLLVTALKTLAPRAVLIYGIRSREVYQTAIPANIRTIFVPSQLESMRHGKHIDR